MADLDGDGFEPLEGRIAECTSESSTVDGRIINYRASRDIVYVSNAVITEEGLTFHHMNLFVPEEYYVGESINGYTAETAPILLLCTSGGYKPGSPADVTGKSGDVVTSALSRGYVVAGPGARGHSNKDPDTGKNVGKAPAGIVDLKAAVRYLRHHDATMPGDVEKIISTGSSAGGAFSSLLGATGNNKDYEPYLKAIGAARERDDIFASSCYCPIMNLDNSDTAYEWQFNASGLFESGRAGDTTRSTLSDEEKEISKDLRDLFPGYLNSLDLRAYDPTVNKTARSGPDSGQVREGASLNLDVEGFGSFRDYVTSFVVRSAQKALDNGQDLSGFTSLRIEGETVTGIDFRAFSDIRMKRPPAFDSLNPDTRETNLFGTEGMDTQHFTRHAGDCVDPGSSVADETIVKMMNPTYYIGAPRTTTARLWRIRHGTEDRHTSLAIPVILATILENNGHDVDCELPWNTRHGGHYDLDEFFAWIDRICSP